uniref:Syncytin-1-like n=2 Tax=Vombatus ursinus TaxID=29139 RepID=A0A4X2KFV1_VOMUR
MLGKRSPLRWCLLAVLRVCLAGFDALAGNDLLASLFGPPCDCRGGYTRVTPQWFSYSNDCNEHTAYLTYRPSTGGGFKQRWECVAKPRVIPSLPGSPGPCHSPCRYYQAIHSLCYNSVQQCSSNNKVYLMAVLQQAYAGTFGGETSATLQGHTNKYAQASCSSADVGHDVCWPERAPLHVSDGGCPSDRAREHEVQQHIEELIQAQFPSLHYHPLARPRPHRLSLDGQTSVILESTHLMLNKTNPVLAVDCWLCLPLGTPIPMALPPLGNLAPAENPSLPVNCSLGPPFRIQPIPLNQSLFVAPCFEGTTPNASVSIDVGFLPHVNCSSVLRTSSFLCPPLGHVFLCGGNMAFPALPVNWTGYCSIASVLPEMDIVPGNKPVPVPSLDFMAGRHKRAVFAIPLLVGLGITGALARGSGGLGVAIHSYNKLSAQLIDDIQTLSGTISDLQDQIDSLAEVVLQNRRGLDLLTAEQGGICLALQEKCCFYANKSGVVRDKIKKLQDDLVKRRRELFENPFLSNLHGFLPYILPLVGPIFVFLLALTFGPWVFRKITSYVKQQLDKALSKPIQVHYCLLDTGDPDLYTDIGRSQGLV